MPGSPRRKPRGALTRPRDWMPGHGSLLNDAALPLGVSERIVATVRMHLMLLNVSHPTDHAPPGAFSIKVPV